MNGFCVFHYRWKGWVNYQVDVVLLICPWDSLWQWKSKCKWSSPSTSITCYPTPSHWWTVSWHHSDLGWKMTGKFIILHCLRNKFLNIASHACMEENKRKRVHRSVIKLFIFFAFCSYLCVHCMWPYIVSSKLIPLARKFPSIEQCKDWWLSACSNRLRQLYFICSKFFYLQHVPCGPQCWQAHRFMFVSFLVS